MAVPYTPRQGQFLAYIHSYIQLHRQSSSEVEMATYFGVSPPSVHQMVVALENRGLIQRTPGQARSIRVLVRPNEMPNLDSGQSSGRLRSAFEASYPDLASWVMRGGWVEIGHTDCTRSMARALNEDEIVWEGQKRYQLMDDLLRDLNEGIAQWVRENA